MWVTQNGSVWYSESEYKRIADDLFACANEYKALVSRYHELQGEYNTLLNMRKE